MTDDEFEREIQYAALDINRMESLMARYIRGEEQIDFIMTIKPRYTRPYLILIRSYPLKERHLHQIFETCPYSIFSENETLQGYVFEYVLSPTAKYSLILKGWACDHPSCPEGTRVKYLLTKGMR